MTQNNSVKDQFEFVFDAFRGFQIVQVISLGLRLGLLVELDKASEGLTHPQLAAKRKLHLPYVRIWCEVGYALGVLNCDDQGRYTLPPSLNTVLLNSEHPRYLGGFAEGFGTYLADDFQRYPQAFVDGNVLPFWERGENFSSWVSQLTHPLQRLVTGKVIPEHFGTQLEHGCDVLDVGCGAGGLIFKLAEMYPKCRFVGIDADAHGINLARREAARLGMSERTSFRHIRGEQVKFSEEFDLALMFEVLHEIPVPERPAVLAGTFRALRPGGKLFIVDETWANELSELREPQYAMSVLIQFTELTWGNVVASENQQTQLLTEAGFGDLRRGDLGGTFTTITATKPD